MVAPHSAPAQGGKQITIINGRMVRTATAPLTLTLCSELRSVGSERLVKLGSPQGERGLRRAAYNSTHGSIRISDRRFTEAPRQLGLGWIPSSDSGIQPYNLE